MSTLAIKGLSICHSGKIGCHCHLIATTPRDISAHPNTRKLPTQAGWPFFFLVNFWSEQGRAPSMYIQRYPNRRFIGHCRRSVVDPYRSAMGRITAGQSQITANGSFLPKVHRQELKWSSHPIDHRWKALWPNRPVRMIAVIDRFALLNCC